MWLVAGKRNIGYGPGNIIYWTVDDPTADGTLEYLIPGHTSRDIFVGAAQVGYSAAPVLYAFGGALSLTEGDDIDGLVVVDDGEEGYSSQTDTVYFSLARNSPTLAVRGFTPGDILISGAGHPAVRLFVDHLLMGLDDTDEMNALDFAVGGPALLGDLDGDGFVGQDDLDIVLGAWGTSPPGDPRADPSGDGFVGQDDLDAVLGDWGQGTLPPSVPEPATLGMFALCGIALSRRNGKSG